LACIEDRRDAYRALVGKPEGKNYLGDRGVDGRIILKKKDFKEVRLGGMYWIDLTVVRNRWRAVVIAVTNLRVPQNVWHFLTR